MKKILLLSISGSSMPIVKVVLRERFYQVNKPVTFCEKPKGSEEFLNRMVKAFGIIIDRHPKGRPHKIES